MPMLYYLNRQFRQVTQGLFVEEPGIERLKKLLAKGERVILLPQYKSFSDQFIILYTLAYYNIEIPFAVGNYEDTPRVNFLDICLRRIGYILAKRSREQSFQEKYVTQAVIREILEKDKFLMMFQNEVRMRGGKFSRPTEPDISIEWLL